MQHSQIIINDSSYSPLWNNLLYMFKPFWRTLPFFLFLFPGKIESAISQLDFHVELPTVSGVFTSTGDWSPVAYCKAGRQQGQHLRIWAHAKQGTEKCLLPVWLLITFSYLISYRSWTQTLWCFAQAHGCRNAFCLHSVSCLLPEWGKSSQLSEDTGIFFVLFSLSYQN